jgi:cellobiose dehydrogenase (acceptor)
MRLLCQALICSFFGAQAAQEWTSQAYDAIVVGAGTAGIIVADRLSEDGRSVLLLEGGSPTYYSTGGRERPSWIPESANLSRVDVPGLYKSFFSNGQNLTCAAWMTDYTGCGIGGSSAVNAGLFFQPPDSDWDSMPDAWQAANLTAAVNRVYNRESSSNITSTDGIRYLQSGYDVARRWIVQALGFAEVDLNQAAEKKRIFGHPIFNYRNGQRGGPATSYLITALQRNVTLKSNIRVLRIVHDGLRATGVVANISGVETTINLALRGRIVVSGGALMSPQLLLFSGIGDEATLQGLASASKLSLPREKWIINSGVGQGLFDNPNTFIELQSDAVQSYTYSYDSPVPQDASNYVLRRAGPYTFASETSVFFDQVVLNGHTFGMQGTIDSSGFGEYLNNNTITLNVYGTSGLLSKGRVIFTEDFRASHSEDVYYSDASQQDSLAIATFIRRIFDGLPGTGLTPLNIPSNASVEQIQQYITTPSKYARGVVNHWSSSCKLGGPSESNPCVDVNAQVLGTQNVHVVDASIIPPVSVNPQFAVMIAAERASELIKKLSS